MVVGILTVDFRIPENSSLKGKRKIVLSLKTRLRNKFNVSVAELEYQDKWQRATLGISSIGGSRRSVNQVLSKAMELVENAPHIEVVNYRMEMV